MTGQFQQLLHGHRLRTAVTWPSVLQVLFCFQGIAILAIPSWYTGYSVLMALFDHIVLAWGMGVSADVAID